MILIILFSCYFGQAYSCARTADVSTTTLAPGVTTTLAPGVTTTTIAGQTTTTIAGQTTTSSTTTSTAAATTTTNRALTCQTADIALRAQPNVPGSMGATAGPIMVVDMANTVTVTCTATAPAMTQMTINDGMFTFAPGTMSSEILTCNAEGKWTITPAGSAPQVVTSVSCNPAMP